MCCSSCFNDYIGNRFEVPWLFDESEVESPVETDAAKPVRTSPGECFDIFDVVSQQAEGKRDGSLEEEEAPEAWVPRTTEMERDIWWHVNNDDTWMMMMMMMMVGSWWAWYKRCAE